MARAAVTALLVATTVCASTAHAGDTVETSGNLLRLAIPAVAAAMTYKRDDQQGRRQFLRSFGANVAATWALKEAVGKRRPDGSGDDAFPSGHSSMAFQGAAFIHRRYGIRSARPMYVLASYVAWTRLDSDEHDSADVAAGIGLGIGSSMLLTRPRTRAEITTALGPDLIGITFSRRF